ncbi:hypothetical protein BGX33_002580 [Mortierella sp. NVP41]|nr:hypothetical protein BGX33_002580 [Mortierella sp. NVP41]
MIPAAIIPPLKSTTKGSAPKRHHHFRFSLYTAATVGLVLLGHPSNSNRVHAFPVIEASSPAVHPQQQILAVHSSAVTFSSDEQITSNSRTSSCLHSDFNAVLFTTVSRVTGKSHEQVEEEIWEERKATEAVRLEQEAQLQQQRQERKAHKEKQRSRIEMKQAGKLVKGSKSEADDQDQDHRHKGAAKKNKDGSGKEDGKQNKGKGKGKGKNKKTGQIKSANGGGGGNKVKTTPTIFYVPHQDDDALAMALAIREHIEAGRRVFVHLYSDGINALLRDIVAEAVPCTLQHPPHKLDLILQDVVTGRTHEFRQSLKALGVMDEDIFETGWSDIEPLKDYGAFHIRAHRTSVLVENTIGTLLDGIRLTEPAGMSPLNSSKSFPKAGQPPYIRALPQYLPYKQKALDQHKRWDPSKGELAWGYHSVKCLIDAAYSDPHVYLDMLDNDPTNPDNVLKKGSSASGGEVKEKEEDGQARGMFSGVWKSSRGKNTKKMLLEEQGNGQEQDDDGLMGLHRKVPVRVGNLAAVNVDIDVEGIGSMSDAANTDTGSMAETRWDEKETGMKLQVLEAFDNATQRPEGKEYHESILAMGP